MITLCMLLLEIEIGNLIDNKLNRISGDKHCHYEVTVQKKYPSAMFQFAYFYILYMLRMAVLLLISRICVYSLEDFAAYTTFNLLGLLFIIEDVM